MKKRVLSMLMAILLFAGLVPAFADNTFSVKIRTVDQEDGSELEGAVIQILDPYGVAVEEWISDGTPHRVEGLKTKTEYTLYTAVSPSGYAAVANTAFDINEDGEVSTTGFMDENGALLVEFGITRVYISTVSASNGSELAGAFVQLIKMVDDREWVVEEWESSGTETIEGLNTETDYIIRVITAPEGCSVPVDTTFKLDKFGKVVSTGSVTEDDTVLVIFEALPTCTVTFMDGSRVHAEITVNENDTLNIGGMPPPALPEGKTNFGGWYAEDGTFVYPGMTVTSDITAYASWITVVDGGKGNVTFERDRADARKMIMKVTPNEGYKLESITVTDEAGSEVTVENNSFIKPSGDITVNASFAKQEYTLTWSNGDGGSYEQTVASGRTITVPTNEFFADTMRKAGYTLTGWTNDEGYSAGDPMPEKDLTFTAVYSANSYKVSFDPNGGAEIAPISVTYGQKYGTLPSSAITGLSGGNKNWYLVDEYGSVTDVNIKNLTKVQTAKDHTLFIKRSVLAPVVKIDLTAPGCISDNYAYYNPENSTRVLTATVSNMNEEVLSYTYEWYKDGELLEGEDESVLTLEGNVKDSGTYKVTVTAALKEGKDIIVSSSSASSSKELKVKILHAANTVYYDANGGSGGASSNYTGGDSIALSSDAPERAGYTFAGWNTAADASGDSYSPGSTYTFSNDNGNGGCKVTVYAIWRANTYSVTLNANGGTVQSGDVSEYTYGIGAKLPTNVKKTGYYFGGWYDNAELSGSAVSQISSDEMGSKTYYAKWIAAPVPEPAPKDPVVDCPRDRRCPMFGYTDLKRHEWYHDGVHFALEKDLMNGVSDDRFDPNGTTTRAMIVTILWRLEGCPVVNYLMQFEDVKAEQWYTEAIRWAAAEGIVTGYSKTAFGPDDAITREQLAAILYRYEQRAGGGFTGTWMMRMDYVDLAEVSDWAYEAMCWMNMKGIITGKPGKVLDPKGFAERAQAAVMLYRYCEVS